MKIKVLRDYSGEEGIGPDKNVEAGSEHVVSRVRGNALFANGLVEILEDEADEPDPLPVDTGPSVLDATVRDPIVAGPEAATVPPEKADGTPLNKASPRPRNKAQG